MIACNNLLLSLIEELDAMPNSKLSFLEKKLRLSEIRIQIEQIKIDISDIKNEIGEKQDYSKMN